MAQSFGGKTMKLKGISDHGMKRIKAQFEEDWQDEHYTKMLSEFEDALADIIPRISDTLPVEETPEGHENWLRAIGRDLARLSWAHDNVWQALTGRHFTSF